MRDGRTRKLERPESDEGFEGWRARWRAVLVVLAGGAEGTEHPVEAAVVTLGRGPGVDVAFDDASMSREHAALEFASEGFRVRDLGSMNGTLLNGGEVLAAELKNGDRVQLGEHVLQFVLEERPRLPRTYVLPDA